MKIKIKSREEIEKTLGKFAHPSYSFSSDKHKFCGKIANIENFDGGVVIAFDNYWHPDWYTVVNEKKWIPKEGERVWLVTFDCEQAIVFRDSYFNRLSHYFRTKKQATEFLKKVKELYKQGIN